MPLNPAEFNHPLRSVLVLSTLRLDSLPTIIQDGDPGGHVCRALAYFQIKVQARAS
jgi:hypothetical protein